MRLKLICGFAIALLLGCVIVRADQLELRNGSVIKGTFLGGTDTQIKFQVGSSVQQYNITDIASLQFDSDRTATDATQTQAPQTQAPQTQDSASASSSSASITIPAGMQLSVRTIDAIDSTKNQVGDPFKASLEEPVVIDGNVVIPKGADVYGRLEEAKTSGTFTGKSELRLALTGIVVNGQTVPLVTGDYDVSGKSKGASTAKRTVGVAALGTIIGAIAGGGKGAAIGAGAGAAAGAGSEVITKGDQVKVPSETLLDFTLQQSVSIPVPAQQN